jgi:cation transporter-like permease
VSWTSPASTSSAADPEAYDEELHHGHVVDRRGLTAAGAVAVALVLGATGGLIDVLTGPGLRTVFAVCFIAGCAIAAFTVHREDLVAAVVMPPLVYVVLALLAGAFSQTAAVGSVLTRQALELASSLVLGAPVLLTATGLAFVIAVLRGISGRTRRT